MGTLLHGLEPGRIKAVRHTGVARGAQSAPYKPVVRHTTRRVRFAHRVPEVRLGYYDIAWNIEMNREMPKPLPFPKPGPGRLRLLQRWGLRLGKQAEFVGESEKFNPVFNADFGIDIDAMGLDGSLADAELFADGSI